MFDPLVGDPLAAARVLFGYAQFPRVEQRENTANRALGALQLAAIRIGRSDDGLKLRYFRMIRRHAPELHEPRA